jgi:transcriptional regulator with XRE-family HTH domain
MTAPSSSPSSSSSSAFTPEAGSEFGPLLRAWRSARSQSQLALSLHAGVSSRHLSYMETGRAKPSREMVLTLADALEIPLRERNALLQAAGYAPMYRETPLEADIMAPIRDALTLVLRSMEPNPALIVNRRYDVLDANASCRWLLRTFSDCIEAFPQPLNLARLLVSPQGTRPYVENWDEVAGKVLRRIRRDLSDVHARDAADNALLRDVAPVLESLSLTHSFTGPMPVLVPVTMRRDGMRLQFFTTIATMGTPMDVTLQELRIETLFPADPETKRIMATQTSSVSPN